MITLRTETLIQASPERCFDLARSVDLHAAGASAIQGRATAGRTAGLSGPGDRTTWTARFFGLRFSLTTEITAYDRPDGFSDVQCAGPFRHFGHVYVFHALEGGRTLMTDEFSYQSPFGPLGAAFDVLLRPRMRAVLAARAETIQRTAAECDSKP